jgi:hypothetical protein
VAESALHRRLKDDVSRELQKDGYIIFFEPIFPPLPGVRWSSYRPDLFGRRESVDGEDFVLVECETQPTMRKMAAKNSGRVWMQTHISHTDTLRRILVIPPGNLRKLDSSIRNRWEIWIVDDHIRRIPPLGEGGRSPSGSEATQLGDSLELPHLIHIS